LREGLVYLDVNFKTEEGGGRFNKL